MGRTQEVCKKTLIMMLAALVVISMSVIYMPEKAYAATVVGNFTVNGGTKGTDYSYDNKNHVLNILTSTALSIATNVESTTDRIKVNSGVSANITLAGVNISQSDTGSSSTGETGNPAFEIADNSTGNVTITLAAGATNRLIGGYRTAGLKKIGTSSSGTLTIKGSGKLIAQNSSGEGSGIGGQYSSGGLTVSNILIESGTIEALGQGSAAGIGGAYKGKAENIRITGGTVTAKATGTGAGIGGGNKALAENIKITGGTVNASSTSGAGIGGGWGESAYVTITGGTVNASSTSGAGIGTGVGSYTNRVDLNGSIKITGGTVTAKTEPIRSSAPSAAIGGGNKATISDIEISGGTVTATAGYNMSDGIGAGYDVDASSIPDVKIYGGSVKASQIRAKTKAADGKTDTHLIEIANPDSKNIMIDYREWKPVNHTAIDSGDTTLYAYLTGDSHIVTIGDMQYNYEYTDGSFVLKNTISVTNPVMLKVGDDNYWIVSYDGGKSWTSLGVKATGDTGTTPQLRVNEGYWQVSYDGTNWDYVTDSSGKKVEATGLKGDQGDKGDKGDQGDKGDKGDQGDKGDKGDKGDTGAAGNDGTTPQLKVGDDGIWYVSYDNGDTWKSLNVKATGNTPQIKVNDQKYWVVSYDNGETWIPTGMYAGVDNEAVLQEIQKLQIASSNVSNLRAANKKGKKVKVSWKAPKGISGLKYEVQYQKKGSKKWVTKTTSNTSLTVKKLKKNAKYRFKVRGYKKIGEEVVYTDYDATSLVKVKK